MKGFFSDVLKLAFFIGLVMAAAYLTGNWEALLRFAKLVGDHLHDAALSVKEAFHVVTTHFGQLM
jgi:hypothetical protein